MEPNVWVPVHRVYGPMWELVSPRRANAEAHRHDGAPVFLSSNHHQHLTTALRTLLDVCQRMDAEHQGARPSEAEYQDAIAEATEALDRAGGE